MVSPFEIAVLRLRDLGFFQFFLPFLLTMAIFYGALRKSQVFGDPDRNVAVNGIISFAAAFWVWSIPILLGIDIQTQLANFFLQSMLSFITIIVGLLIAGTFFPPDLPKHLSDKLGSREAGIVLIAALLLGAGLVVSSGLWNVFFPPGFGQVISDDVILTVVVIIALLVAVVAIVGIGGQK